MNDPDDNDLASPPPVVTKLKEVNGWQTTTKKEKKNNKTSKHSNSIISLMNSDLVNDAFNQSSIQLVKGLVSSKVKCLIVLRGSPGSGKSFLACQIKFNGMIASADEYFTHNGIYKYDPLKINDAHNYCKTRVNDAIKNGTSPVIIDNTNAKIWEFKPYVQMALKNNYQVEILEPSTPWCQKNGELAAKNIHNVPINKIKKYFIDYDKCDLQLLIEQCNGNQNKNPKPKPGGFLANFNEILSCNDWSSTENSNLATNESILPAIKPIISEEKNKLSNNLFNSFLKSTPIIELVQIKNSVDTVELNEIKQMFPSVKSETIIELLEQYQDSNTVTNILLDSINLDEIETSNQNVNTKHNVKSLKELCTDSLCRLEHSFEQFYDKDELNANRFTNQIESIKEENDSFDLTSLDLSNSNDYTVKDVDNYEEIESIPSTETCSELSFNSQMNYSDSKDSSDYDDEPILNLKLDVKFLKTLVQLFGSDEDEKILDTQNVDIGLKLGYQLFNSWKRTASNSTPNATGTNATASNDLKWDKQIQIENDEKLSKQLFDEINMRNPIEKQPVYLSENGINSAQFSLRQIMAEQAAEAEKEKQRQKKNSIFDLTKKTVIKYDVKNFNIEFNYKLNKSDKKQVEYYNLCTNEYKNEDLNQKSSESRLMAGKYSNLKQEYLKKAEEAYKRGWGLVAQYYADMARCQSETVKKYNENASQNAFLSHNPDIKNSPTLDLHGLHVKEAISALKQVMFEKKQRLLHYSMGKKQKTYLYVITGIGHNSENGPKLRPNVINYLNQNRIKYKEPHAGLLRIDLLTNVADF